MTTFNKQDAFLKILGRMIGAMNIEPVDVKYVGNNAPKCYDVFNKMMDAAIEKAHQAMAESEAYAEAKNLDQFTIGIEKDKKELKQKVVDVICKIHKDYGTSEIPYRVLRDYIKSDCGVSTRTATDYISIADELGMLFRLSATEYKFTNTIPIIA